MKLSSAYHALQRLGMLRTVLSNIHTIDERERENHDNFFNFSKENIHLTSSAAMVMTKLHNIWCKTKKKKVEDQDLNSSMQNPLGWTYVAKLCRQTGTKYETQCYKVTTVSQGLKHDIRESTPQRRKPHLGHTGLGWKSKSLLILYVITNNNIHVTTVSWTMEGSRLHPWVGMKTSTQSYKQRSSRNRLNARRVSNIIVNQTWVGTEFLPILLAAWCSLRLVRPRQSSGRRRDCSL